MLQHGQEPHKVGEYTLVERINDMIIDDQSNYFLAGDKGFLEVHNQQITSHLQGEWIKCIHRIDPQTYIIANWSNKKLQIYNIESNTVIHTI